jgi:hypothetical protein
VQGECRYDVYDKFCRSGAFRARDIISGYGVGGEGHGLLKKDPGEGNLLEKK